MPAITVAPGLLSWASDLEPGTVEQAARTARLPVVAAAGHVALMPDAHVGIGSTVGSVVPTLGAVIPSCVGVDIGCGMVATETDLRAEDLPDSLDPLLDLVARLVPSGVGRGHAEPVAPERYAALGRPATELPPRLARTAAEQFGTLGSGNHFAEVCLDERGTVWTVLHSGSRGVGNQLAKRAIEQAKGLVRERHESLEDLDLAYLVEGTEEFRTYVADMLWAQDYALGSRAVMAERLTGALLQVVGHGAAVRQVNCHHNFTQREEHGGRSLWVTRKGAIKAGVGDEGVIPGSMGAATYVVRGKGAAASYRSCSHGAGRRLSRAQARKAFDAASLSAAMGDRTWDAADAERLLDEHPSAYKDIDQVMADQTDLVEVQHVLHQVLNHKGT